MNQAARRKRALVLLALILGAVVLGLAIWQLLAFGFRGGVLSAMIVSGVVVIVAAASLIGTTLKSP